MPDSARVRNAIRFSLSLSLSLSVSMQIVKCEPDVGLQSIEARKL